MYVHNSASYYILEYFGEFMVYGIHSAKLHLREVVHKYTFDFSWRELSAYLVVYINDTGYCLFNVVLINFYQDSVFIFIFCRS